VKKARHKRPHIVLFHLYKVSRIDKSIETKKRLVVLGAIQRGNGEYYLIGTRFPFEVMKCFGTRDGSYTTL
jgi:hypothetical protein